MACRVRSSHVNSSAVSVPTASSGAAHLQHGPPPSGKVEVPETTGLAQAVGSSLPLYLYRAAEQQQQQRGVLSASRARRFSGLRTQPEDHEMLIEEEEAPGPQVPEWGGPHTTGSDEHDGSILGAMQHCYHSALKQQLWAPAAAAAPAAPAAQLEAGAGVVPTLDHNASVPTSSAPRRSLSLSAINHTTSNAMALPSPPAAVRSREPALLFRGLSAANLCLMTGTSPTNASNNHGDARPAADGMAMVPTSPSSTTTNSVAHYRLPHVLSATTTATTSTSTAAGPLLAAQSSLYRMSDSSEGGPSGGSDVGMSMSPAEASPRSSSPMLPRLALEEEEAEDAMQSLLELMGGAAADQPSSAAAVQAQQQLAAPPSSNGSSRAQGLRRQLQQHQPGTLDTLLAALWEDCDARGLFRYDVASCSTRVLEGAPLRWVVQLNEGRATKKRPTELKLDAVLQAFDAGRFHFGKAAVREALLQFEPLAGGSAGGAGSAMGAGAAYQQQVAGLTGARLLESSPMPANPTLVLINVSPIEHGHVLLVPRVLAQRPQQLGDAGVIGEALAFVREMGNPAFRVGYNSLGAYASINHLHFQGYYLNEPFACELATVAPLPWHLAAQSNERATAAATLDVPTAEALVGLERAFPRVAVGTLADYPVLGWVVEQRRPSPTGAAMEVEEGEARAAEAEMAAVLARLTAGLEERDQPYNVFVVDCGRRAFVWPQCFGERQAAGLVPDDVLDTGVNPAAFEIAGHLLVKRQEDYDAVTDAWATRLLAQASLPAARFAQLSRACLLGMAA